MLEGFPRGRGKLRRGTGAHQSHQHPVPFNHVYFATQVWLLREAVLVGRGAHTGHSWGHELVLDLALLA